MLFHQLPAVHGDAVRSQRLVYAQPVLPRAAIPLVLLVCWKGDEGMHKIVVQPGQTLWSIASRAEPSADPRLVVQEIMTANALTGPAIVAGELLWIPR